MTPARIRPASLEREARAILSAGRGNASLLVFARLALGLPAAQPFAHPAPAAQPLAAPARADEEEPDHARRP